MRNTLRLVAGLSFAPTAEAQPFLNLDFEISPRGKPRSRSTGSSGYACRLDAAEYRSGRQSLEIRYRSGPANTLGLASRTLPVALVRGRRGRYSGWIKTEDVKTGYAAPWMRVDGVSG
jgi:hypothetical protein